MGAGICWIDKKLELACLKLDSASLHLQSVGPECALRTGPPTNRYALDTAGN